MSIAIEPTYQYRFHYRLCDHGGEAPHGQNNRKKHILAHENGPSVYELQYSSLQWDL